MSTDTTSKRYSRELVCYRDTDEAEAVCGECGRPVCGPLRDSTLGGLVRSVFNDYGHGQLFHDATFHHYENGLGRVLLALGLLGVSVLFSVIVPGLIPTIVSETISRPIGLKPAIIQSSAILGLAALATLRYQRGERKTSFRIQVRRTADRVLCDECFENTLVQLALSYLITIVVLLLVIMGLRNAITAESALPLRTAALGLAIGIIGDDLVAYFMTALKSGGKEPNDGQIREAEIDQAGDEETGPEIEPDDQPVSGGSSTEE